MPTTTVARIPTIVRTALAVHKQRRAPDDRGLVPTDDTEGAHQ